MSTNRDLAEKGDISALKAEIKGLKIGDRCKRCKKPIAPLPLADCWCTSCRYHSKGTVFVGDDDDETKANEGGRRE